jgi:hypothetical protein
VLELVFLRGQVPPFSLNPQLTRHHHLPSIVSDNDNYEHHTGIVIDELG